MAHDIDADPPAARERICVAVDKCELAVLPGALNEASIQYLSINVDVRYPVGDLLRTDLAPVGANALEHGGERRVIRALGALGVTIEARP